MTKCLRCGVRISKGKAKWRKYCIKCANVREKESHARSQKKTKEYAAEVGDDSAGGAIKRLFDRNFMAEVLE